MAYYYCFDKQWYFGPWDQENEKPSTEAEVAFLRQVQQWAANPETAAMAAVIKFRMTRANKLLSPLSKSMARAAQTRNVVGEEVVRETLGHLFPSTRPLLWCLWYTGARPSELCQLRVCDLRRCGKVTSLSGVELDLDELGVWCAVLMKHKTMDKSKDRVVFFGPTAQSWILQVLEGRTANGKAPLFPNEDGNHFTPPALQNKVRRACIHHGVVGWQVYSMRHTRSVKVQQKYGRDAARAVLGHTGGITGGYAGVDLTTAAKVMAEMG